MTETPPQAPPPGVTTENLTDYSRLFRSRSDRKLAGVAGGLGRHLNVDPTILRVLFVVLTFFGGAGLLLYAAAWLIVPDEESGEAVFRTSDSLRNGLLIGAFVVAALIALGDHWGGGFPFLVIVGGVVAFVLLRRDNKSNVPAYYYGPPAPGTPQPTWSPEGTQVLQPGWYPPPPAPPLPRKPKRTGPILFGFTLALIALALGVLGVYDASGHDVVDSAYPALALAVTGLMLVLGSFFGRPGGLILVGLIASFSTLVAGVANPGFQGDRDQVYRPTLASQVQDTYRVPAGRIELDLTDLRELEALDGRTISLSANAGEIVVIVPRDLSVDLTASVAFAGAIETPRTTRDGFDTQVEQRLTATDPRAEISLDIELRVGHIEVRQP